MTLGEESPPMPSPSASAAAVSPVAAAAAAAAAAQSPPSMYHPNPYFMQHQGYNFQANAKL